MLKLERGISKNYYHSSQVETNASRVSGEDIKQDV